MFFTLLYLCTLVILTSHARLVSVLVISQLISYYFVDRVLITFRGMKVLDSKLYCDTLRTILNHKSTD